jgi:hypothetical protein
MAPSGFLSHLTKCVESQDLRLEPLDVRKGDTRHCVRASSDAICPESPILMVTGVSETAHNPRQPDREGRAAAGLALDRDVTAHHLTEAPTDGEAKAQWDKSWQDQS